MLRRVWWAILLLAAVGLGALGCRPSRPVDQPSDGYLFCFWNVENFFDDQLDGYKREPDKSYDAFFANDKPARDRKIANLCKVLLGMNGGKGPDILGLVEVESYRAAELLQGALNGRLADSKDHYSTVLFKMPGAAGRHIGCAVLTRLKVEKDRTQLLGKRQRIMEAHLEAEGQELVVVVAHWTSRLTDRTGARRAKYGDQIYGRYRAMHRRNPNVAFLVAGDFNDDPTDDSVVKHLRAVGDRERVLAGGDTPLLYNLFAEAHQKGEATLYDRAKPHVFDQIAVAPALLGTGPGWKVVPGSARIVPEMATRQGRPDRFGGPNDRRSLDQRGASDHFPVTVRLRAQR
jgi:endonuclease/exonuclease/phosphatase family metal-dependent hydrolase